MADNTSSGVNSSQCIYSKNGALQSAATEWMLSFRCCLHFIDTSTLTCTLLHLTVSVSFLKYAKSQSLRATLCRHFCTDVEGHSIHAGTAPHVLPLLLTSALEISTGSGKVRSSSVSRFDSKIDNGVHGSDFLREKVAAGGI